ncbi:hypothetical protein G6F62_015391 [Rhizopus arrhizus]|uniref:Uncharacterized protein n=1 Tax=Rhizopus oryzae TaxID=64495 RepID=A0A9P6WTD2_RHIOR|nr:hypothetical protein G6F22_016859 [Rhizopus arrhizus]KAG0772848.1 hypothetical protein G6F21_014418 [Rhizopus arrhizus]KAG0971862.1 hypothetical protein G6F28_014178 [Rhizopus arrhizus]KAG0994151.1 hypothetical protein G6F27_014096 [Rhizopus arrhizus]KAG1075742.1 hypothetical protein G6F40_017387 [Rhizopus arrhizus]
MIQQAIRNELNTHDQHNRPYKRNARSNYNNFNNYNPNVKDNYQRYNNNNTVRDKISPFFGFFAMPRQELNLGLRFADETFARKLDKIIGVT